MIRRPRKDVQRTPRIIGLEDPAPWWRRPVEWGAGLLYAMLAVTIVAAIVTLWP